MKKIIVSAVLVLLVIAVGFLIPYLSSVRLSDEYALGVASAIEPLAIFYPGIRYSDKQISTDRCTDRNLKQVLLQTYFWMFIPGPLIELCVYPDDPTTVKSAGIIE